MEGATYEVDFGLTTVAVAVPALRPVSKSKDLATSLLRDLIGLDLWNKRTGGVSSSVWSPTTPKIRFGYTFKFDQVDISRLNALGVHETKMSIDKRLKKQEESNE